MNIRNIIKPLQNLVYLLILLPSLAIAEERISDNTANLNDRLDRMERDLNIVQKQFYRGGSNSTTTTKPKISGLDVESADIESRMLLLEEQMRDLNGRIEETQFTNKQIQEKLDMISNDVEQRFQRIEKNPAVSSNNTNKPVNNSSTIEKAAIEDSLSPKQDLDDAAAINKLGQTKFGQEKTLNQQLKEKEAQPAANPQIKSKELESLDNALDGKNSEDEEAAKMEMYNKAIEHIKKSETHEAEKLLDQFITKYKDDPLVSNAYYWYGEVFYTKKLYEKAAIQYLKGYKKFPKGKKAADSLLKLSMSLSNIKKGQESCKMLDKLYDRFPDMAASIRNKADKEYRRAGCAR